LKQVLLAAALALAPTLAFAQEAPNAQASAAQSAVMDQFQLLIAKNAQIAALQAQVSDLQAKLTAATKPVEAPSSK